MQAAGAQLRIAHESVTQLRDQLAAVSSDFKAQLVAKSAQLDEAQACNARLTGQLADLEQVKLQAESHAGRRLVVWPAQHHPRTSVRLVCASSVSLYEPSPQSPKLPCWPQLAAWPC